MNKDGGEIMQEIIKVDNITKEFGYKENKTEVLKNISFSINKGEFVSMMGASGSREKYYAIFNRRTGYSDKGEYLY